MAEERAGLIKSPLSVTEASDNITEQSTTLNTTGVFFYLWKFDVPLGTAFEVTPVNFFFIDLLDTASNALTVASTLRIVKANQNEAEIREVWSGPDSLFSGNLYDEFQRPKLRAPVLWNASQKLVIQVNMGATLTGGLSPANSTFVVEGMQFYEEV